MRTSNTDGVATPVHYELIIKVSLFDTLMLIAGELVVSAMLLVVLNSGWVPEMLDAVLTGGAAIGVLAKVCLDWRNHGKVVGRFQCNGREVVFGALEQLQSLHVAQIDRVDLHASDMPGVSIQCLDGSEHVWSCSHFQATQRRAIVAHLRACTVCAAQRSVAE